VHEVGDKKSYTMMHGQPIIKICTNCFVYRHSNHKMLHSKRPTYSL